MQTIQYFAVVFALCLVLSGIVAAIFHRKSDEPGRAHWVGALVFSLLVAAALTLLNLGR